MENVDELAARLLKKGVSFSEISRGTANTTELVAGLISQGTT